MAKREVVLDINVNGEDQIQNVNKSLEQTSISAEKIADNTLKATKGIAGGFELAAQAAGLFGEETEAAFSATIKRATEYTAMSNALKDVAEGFSKENIKGLTGIFQGFTKAGIGAKLFGNTTKIAIASTGIGLLVVAVGLLAANWDTVTEAVGEFIDSVPGLKRISDAISGLVDKVGSLSNLFSGIASYIGALFTDGADAAEAFNNAIEKGKAVDALNEQTEALANVNAKREDSIKLLETEGKKEKEVFAIKKQIQQESINNLNERKKLVGELTKEEQKNLDAAILSLKVLEIQEKKFNDTQVKEANDAAKKIADERKKLKEERIKEEDDAQKRIADLRIQAIKDNEQRELAAVANEYKQKLEALKFGSKFYTEEVLLLTKAEEEKKAEIRGKYFRLQIKESIDNLKEINDQTAKFYSEQDGGLESLTNTLNKLNQVVYDFGLDEEFADAIKSVNAQFKELGIEATNVNGHFAVLKKTTEELLQASAVEDIAQKAQLVKLDQFNQERLNYEIEYLKNKTKLTNEEQVVLDRMLIERNAKEDEINLERSEKEQEAFQAKVDAINAYAELAGQVTGQIFDIFIQSQQRQLTNLQTQFQLVDSQYTEAVNNRRALEGELETAEGARRIEILNSIKKEASAEKQLAAEKEKLLKKQADIQYAIQLAEWRNSVIQSVLLTAQAVLNALATVPPASFAFAAVTAALAGIQTVIVASQKPVKGSFAVGGFTGEGFGMADETGQKPAGIVHQDEWVAPKWMVKNSETAGLIGQLESYRQTKKFADGGFTTPVIESNTGGSTDALIAALKGLNLQVAVTEINQGQQQVEVIQNRASL